MEELEICNAERKLETRVIPALIAMSNAMRPAPPVKTQTTRPRIGAIAAVVLAAAGVVVALGLQLYHRERLAEPNIAINNTRGATIPTGRLWCFTHNEQGEPEINQADLDSLAPKTQDGGRTVTCSAAVFVEGTPQAWFTSCKPTQELCSIDIR